MAAPQASRKLSASAITSTKAKNAMIPSMAGSKKRLRDFIRAIQHSVDGLPRAPCPQRAASDRVAVEDIRPGDPSFP